MILFSLARLNYFSNSVDNFISLHEKGFTFFYSLCTHFFPLSYGQKIVESSEDYHCYLLSVRDILQFFSIFYLNFFFN